MLFEGRDVRDVPVHQRDFGLMFQDQALFPHKNVFENIAFGLQMQRLPEETSERECKTSPKMGVPTAILQNTEVA